LRDAKKLFGIGRTGEEDIFPVFASRRSKGLRRCLVLDEDAGRSEQAQAEWSPSITEKGYHIVY
jgi:hypothetical protein